MSSMTVLIADDHPLFRKGMRTLLESMPDIEVIGESNVAIAEQLTITLKTVRNHVSNIYNKLQVADRAQAVIRARDAGLS